jgi:hypothetical protein
MLKKTFLRFLIRTPKINYKLFTSNSNASDAFDQVNFMPPMKLDQPSINISRIRSLDVGKNYFSKIDPKRRKYLITLLNSYSKIIPEDDLNEFEAALDIYFNNQHEGKCVTDLREEKLNLSMIIIQHLYFLMTLDRLSSQYARYDYLDYHTIIQQLNSRKNEDRNKVKYVFTSHPTQPNSVEQLVAITKILKGLEENDTCYMDYWMNEFIVCTTGRKFEKPTYLQESVAYHSLYLNNLIRSMGMAWELGLKDISDYFEIPGTWMSFDFDNHPGMEVGIMTYTHGMVIELTIMQYKRMIEKAMHLDFKIFSDLMQNFDISLDYSKKLQTVSKLFLDKKIDKDEFFISIGII